MPARGEGESATKPLTVLLIDGDLLVLQTVRAVLSSLNVELLHAPDAEKGLQILSQAAPGIVVLSDQLPDATGLETLEQICRIDPGIDVVLTTDHYSADAAVAAIRKGATDLVAKPLEDEDLLQRINSLIAHADKRNNVLKLDRELLDAYQFQSIVGRSPAILQTFAKIRRVAPHFRTVLVTGATGTGKELVARALHQLSPASSGPFVICNCSALVETLLESELFGHVKGAFTGATQDRMGVFEYGRGGVVFLDEIGELSLGAQAKLLRVLQNRELQRVGSPATHTVDVRVIAATHRNLRSLVSEGRFREDLYYRLSPIEIGLPRLSERKEDLPLLQRYFVGQFAAQYNKRITGITRRAQALLARYSWPGNVRELQNVIGNACMMAEGNVVDVQDLPSSLRAVASRPDRGDPDLITLDEVQQRHLNYVLQRVGGNKARTAEILGISRATVYEMLAKKRHPEEEMKDSNDD